MNSWRIILATVVIFGSGVVTGGLLVNYVERAYPRPPHGVNRNNPAKPGGVELPVPRPQLLNQQFVKQLDEKLNLTPEQRGKIEEIITEGQERNRDLWKQIAPQLRSVNQDVRQRIRAVLMPEQRKQFEELMKQLGPRRPPAFTNAPAVSPPTNTLPESATNAPAPAI